jgi:hypothetical protein
MFYLFNIEFTCIHNGVMMFNLIKIFILFFVSNIMAQDNSNLLTIPSSGNFYQAKQDITSNLETKGTTDFSENFSGGVLPIGWVVADVDGLTPHVDVSQFTDGWIVDEDPDNPSNFTAQSTSKYNPAGQADDWIITPLINLSDFPNLVWVAQSIDPLNQDGYEIYISTTTQDVAGCSQNSAIFSITEESSQSTFHRVNLYQLGFINQSVYVCFRNNSIDKNILQLEVIQIQNQAENDIGISAVNTPSEYTQHPITLGDFRTPLFINVRNNGYNDQLLVRASIEILKNGVTHTTISQYHIRPFGQFPFGFFTANYGFLDISEIGHYEMIHSVEIIGSIGEGSIDEQPMDNQYPLVDLVTITSQTMARDDNIPIGDFGIAAGNGAQIGQEFTINSNTSIKAASFAYNNKECDLITSICSLDGLNFTVDLLELDSITNLPGNILASTNAYSIPNGESINTEVNLDFIGGPLSLPAGTYVLIINEPIDPNPEDMIDVSAQIVTTDSNFRLGKTWINWPENPTGDWIHNEDLDLTDVYYLRIIFEDTLFKNSFE